MKRPWKGFDRYRRLASVMGPPGLEGPVRDEWKRMVEPYVDRLETDRIGNLYAFMGQDAGPTLMFCAHMDEVAGVVAYVMDCGKLGMLPQGLLRAASFRMQPVCVLGRKGPVPGVSRVEPQKDNPQISDVVIDVGARDADGVRKLGIRPGDRICFHADIYQLGADRVVSKSTDDRVGLYILAEAARRLKGKKPPVRVALVGTAQEEAIDTFAAWAGARAVARHVDASAVIAIDTTGAGDELPSNDRRRMAAASLQKGFAISRGAQDLHPHLVECVIEMAARMGFRHQIVARSATGCDCTVICRERGGIPCAFIGIPILRSHSAQEEFCWKAAEDAADFVSAMIMDPRKLLESAARPH